MTALIWTNVGPRDWQNMFAACMLKIVSVAKQEQLSLQIQ